MTLIAFISTSLQIEPAWAAKTFSRPSIDGPVVESNSFKDLNVETFSLPEGIGKIKSVYKGSSDKVIVHIQDAHCNFQCQGQIASIVEYLGRVYGIDTVDLEGGSGAYDVDVLGSITNTDLRRKVSEYFVKEGLLGGAEFVGVNNPKAVNLWGMEDADLYMENLSIYRSSLKDKPKADQYINALSHDLNSLKSHIFSKDLIELDMKYAQFKAGNIEFKDYLIYLNSRSEALSIDMTLFPNIILLVRAIDLGDSIDYRRAQIERDQLIASLNGKLSKNEMEELVRKMFEFRSDRISQQAFYEHIVGKAAEVGVDINDYSELKRYVDYISIYARTDKVMAVTESGYLEKALKEAMYKNDAQRELDLLSKNLTLTRNLFSISLTKEDYEYYLGSAGSFRVQNYLDFIGKYAPAYNVEIQTDSRAAGALDKFRLVMAGFFECSMKRDQAFVRNIKYGSVGSSSSNSGRRAAIVITGGFHSENLYALLKKEGVSYVSILPAFKDPKGYKCRYFDLLAGRRNAVESSISEALSSSLAIASSLNRLGVLADGEISRRILDIELKWKTASLAGKGLLVLRDGKVIAAISMDGAPVSVLKGARMGPGQIEPDMWETLDLAETAGSKQITDADTVRLAKIGFNKGPEDGKERIRKYFGGLLNTNGADNKSAIGGYIHPFTGKTVIVRHKDSDDPFSHIGGDVVAYLIPQGLMNELVSFAKLHPDLNMDRNEESYDPFTNTLGLGEKPLVFPHEAGHVIFYRMLLSPYEKRERDQAWVKKFWNGNFGDPAKAPVLTEEDVPAKVREYAGLIGAVSVQKMTDRPLSRENSVCENFAHNIERLTFGKPFITCPGSKATTRDILDYFISIKILDENGANRYLELAKRANNGNVPLTIDTGKNAYVDDTGELLLEAYFSAKVMDMESSLGRKLTLAEEVAVRLDEKDPSAVEGWIKRDRAKLIGFMMKLSILSPDLRERIWYSAKVRTSRSGSADTGAVLLAGIVGIFTMFTLSSYPGIVNAKMWILIAACLGLPAAAALCVYYKYCIEPYVFKPQLIPIIENSFNEPGQLPANNNSIEMDGNFKPRLSEQAPVARRSLSNRLDDNTRGVKFLADIINKPTGYDWALAMERGELTDPVGLYLGETNGPGGFVFNAEPGHSYMYNWPALGYHDGGWKAHIVRAGAYKNRYEFVVRFTKKGYDTFEKSYCVTNVTKTIKQKGKDRSREFLDIIDKDRRPGLDVLKYMITRPASFNWEKAMEAGDLPDIEGMTFGGTNRFGSYVISIGNRKFSWNALGTTKIASMTAVCTSTGFANKCFEFTLKFSGEGEEDLTKTYRIGPLLEDPGIGRKIWTIRETGSKAGVEALSLLVNMPPQKNWQRASMRKDFPRLKGLGLGELGSTGGIEFSPVPKYDYFFPILGKYDGQKGWKAVVVDDGATEDYYWFKVKLSREGEAPVYRSFCVGPFSAKIGMRSRHRENSQDTGAVTVLEIKELDSEAGKRGVESLLRLPVGVDWKAEEDAGRLPSLKGLGLGKVSRDGIIYLRPIPYFAYKWRAFGDTASGWDARIVDSRVKDGMYLLTVRFTMRDPNGEMLPLGIERVFKIGPERIKLRSKHTPVAKGPEVFDLKFVEENEVSMLPPKNAERPGAVRSDRLTVDSAISELIRDLTPGYQTGKLKSAILEELVGPILKKEINPETVEAVQIELAERFYVKCATIYQLKRELIEEVGILTGASPVRNSGMTRSGRITKEALFGMSFLAGIVTLAASGSSNIPSLVSCLLAISGAVLLLPFVLYSIYKICFVAKEGIGARKTTVATRQAAAKDIAAGQRRIAMQMEREISDQTLYEALARYIKEPKAKLSFFAPHVLISAYASYQAAIKKIEEHGVKLSEINDEDLDYFLTSVQEEEAAPGKSIKLTGKEKDRVAKTIANILIIDTLMLTDSYVETAIKENKPYLLDTILRLLEREAYGSKICATYIAYDVNRLLCRDHTNTWMYPVLLGLMERLYAHARENGWSSVNCIMDGLFRAMVKDAKNALVRYEADDICARLGINKTDLRKDDETVESLKAAKTPGGNNGLDDLNPPRRYPPGSMPAVFQVLFEAGEPLTIADIAGRLGRNESTIEPDMRGLCGILGLAEKSRVDGAQAYRLKDEAIRNSVQVTSVLKALYYAHGARPTADAIREAKGLVELALDGGVVGLPSFTAIERFKKELAAYQVAGGYLERSDFRTMTKFEKAVEEARSLAPIYAKSDTLLGPKFDAAYKRFEKVVGDRRKSLEAARRNEMNRMLDALEKQAVRTMMLNIEDYLLSEKMAMAPHQSSIASYPKDSAELSAIMGRVRALRLKAADTILENKRRQTIFDETMGDSPGGQPERAVFAAGKEYESNGAKLKLHYCLNASEQLNETRYFIDIEAPGRNQPHDRFIFSIIDDPSAGAYIKLPMTVNGILSAMLYDSRHALLWLWTEAIEAKLPIQIHLEKGEYEYLHSLFAMRPDELDDMLYGTDNLKDASEYRGVPDIRRYISRTTLKLLPPSLTRTEEVLLGQSLDEAVVDAVSGNGKLITYAWPGHVAAAANIYKKIAGAIAKYGKYPGPLSDADISNFAALAKAGKETEPGTYSIDSLDKDRMLGHVIDYIFSEDVLKSIGNEINDAVRSANEKRARIAISFLMREGLANYDRALKAETLVSEIITKVDPSTETAEDIIRFFKEMYSRARDGKGAMREKVMDRAVSALTTASKSETSGSIRRIALRTLEELGVSSAEAMDVTNAVNSVTDGDQGQNRSGKIDNEPLLAAALGIVSMLAVFMAWRYAEVAGVTLVHWVAVPALISAIGYGAYVIVKRLVNRAGRPAAVSFPATETVTNINLPYMNPNWLLNPVIIDHHEDPDEKVYYNEKEVFCRALVMVLEQAAKLSASKWARKRIDLERAGQVLADDIKDALDLEFSTQFRIPDLKIRDIAEGYSQSISMKSKDEVIVSLMGVSIAKLRRGDRGRGVSLTILIDDAGAEIMRQSLSGKMKADKRVSSLLLKLMEDNIKRIPDDPGKSFSGTPLFRDLVSILNGQSRELSFLWPDILMGTSRVCSKAANEMLESGKDLETASLEEVQRAIAGILRVKAKKVDQDTAIFGVTTTILKKSYSDKTMAAASGHAKEKMAAAAVREVFPGLLNKIKDEFFTAFNMKGSYFSMLFGVIETEVARDPMLFAESAKMAGVMAMKDGLPNEGYSELVKLILNMADMHEKSQAYPVIRAQGMSVLEQISNKSQNRIARLVAMNALTVLRDAVPEGDTKIGYREYRAVAPEEEEPDYTGGSAIRLSGGDLTFLEHAVLNQAISGLITKNDKTIFVGSYLGMDVYALEGLLDAYKSILKEMTNPATGKLYTAEEIETSTDIIAHAGHRLDRIYMDKKVADYLHGIPGAMEKVAAHEREHIDAYEENLRRAGFVSEFKAKLRRDISSKMYEPESSVDRLKEASVSKRDVIYIIKASGIFPNTEDDIHMPSDADQASIEGVSVVSNKRIAADKATTKDAHAIPASGPAKDQLASIFAPVLSEGDAGASGVSMITKHPFRDGSITTYRMDAEDVAGPIGPEIALAMIPDMLARRIVDNIASRKDLTVEAKYKHYDPRLSVFGLGRQPLHLPRELGRMVFVDMLIDEYDVKKMGREGSAKFRLAQSLDIQPDAEVVQFVSPQLVKDYAKLIGAYSYQRLIDAPISRENMLSEHFALNVERLCYGQPFVVCDGSGTGTGDMLAFFMKIKLIDHDGAERYLELSRRLNDLGGTVRPIHSGVNIPIAPLAIIAKESYYTARTIDMEARLNRKLDISEEIALRLGEDDPKEVGNWINAAPEKVIGLMNAVGVNNRGIEHRVMAMTPITAVAKQDISGSHKRPDSGLGLKLGHLVLIPRRESSPKLAVIRAIYPNGTCKVLWAEGTEPRSKSVPIQHIMQLNQDIGKLRLTTAGEIRTVEGVPTLFFGSVEGMPAEIIHEANSKPRLRVVARTTKPADRDKARLMRPAMPALSADNSMENIDILQEYFDTAYNNIMLINATPCWARSTNPGDDEGMETNFATYLNHYIGPARNALWEAIELLNIGSLSDGDIKLLIGAMEEAKRSFSLMDSLVAAKEKAADMPRQDPGTKESPIAGNLKFNYFMKEIYSGPEAEHNYDMIVEAVKRMKYAISTMDQELNKILKASNTNEPADKIKSMPMPGALNGVLSDVRFGSEERVIFLQNNDDANKSLHLGNKNEIRRQIARQYGNKVTIVFHDGTEDGLRKAYYTVKDLLERPNALALAYVGPDQHATALKVFGAGNEQVKWIQEDTNGSQYIDETSHVVLAVGILDYVRSGYSREYNTAKLLELIETMAADPASIEALKKDFRNIFSSAFSLKIKPHNFEDIQSWKRNQDALLRSL